jgi:hypothetical protein
LWITFTLLINKPKEMPIQYCVSCDKPIEKCICKPRFGMTKDEIAEMKQRQKKAKKFDAKNH